MGKPALDLKYKTFKNITLCTLLLNVCIIIYTVKLFLKSIQTHLTVGYYINMVTENDGNVLPTLLAMPGLLTLPLNVVSVYLLYKAFSTKKQPKLNLLMFVHVMVSVVSVCIMLIMCIMVLSHVYAASDTLHDGITDAMRNYSSNSLIKTQIDLLQIEFQCCGSKQYSEWYDIQWYDTNLIKNSNDKQQAPFSCCSMTSMFPCIHHGIESKTLPYHYSHELNFSISPNGCFEAIGSKKKSVGWGIIGNICILLLLQLWMTTGFRFIQTAHSTENRFAADKSYTTWLIGWNTTKSKPTPPPVPPVPKDLMK